MEVASTRSKGSTVSFREAVFHGLAPDGGLYHPVREPDLSGVFSSLRPDASFQEVAAIHGDSERILEMIENLVSNAIDAMPSGGELFIGTGTASVKGVLYATITIGDTGEGIRAEDLPRIFEPFFTTKVSPKGVGLGLPIVKKFMEDHGGFIEVKSRFGQGTTFVLFFPYPGAVGLTGEEAAREG